MEQIKLKLDTIEDVKREIDLCQRKAMTSVVELGYILRKADDAELYKQEGYTSIYKFAKEIYGWDQSQTSRFMDINREFSEGGYSTTLKKRYEGFGKAKLAEMLTLPETVREELVPDIKREEIREIKRDMNEAAAEHKKETFEKTVTMQDLPDPLKDTVQKLFCLPDMARKVKKLYPYMQSIEKNESVLEEDIRMIIAMSGFGTVRAGGAMYFWRKDDFSIIQGNDKRICSYTDLLKAINDFSLPEENSAEEWYYNTYERELPVEKGNETKQTKPKTKQKEQTTKVTKQKKAQSIENSTQERVELPGQEEIKDHAEEMQIKYEEIEEAEECPYCTEKQDIISSNGLIRISLSNNGYGKITGGIEHGDIVFSYCPMCGKGLKGE